MASQAKSTTCCGKSDSCVCGKLLFYDDIPPDHEQVTNFSKTQPNKPSAHVASSPPSTATATRPPRRTPSQAPAAPAALDPPVTAPATGPRPRMSSLPVVLVPVDLDLLVSLVSPRSLGRNKPRQREDGVTDMKSRCLHVREGR